MKKYLKLEYFWIALIVLFFVYVTAFIVSFWACAKFDIWCYPGSFAS